MSASETSPVTPVTARVLIGNPAYRKFFVARFISNLGNGIAPIALAFGVLAIPGATPTSLSIVLVAQAIPLVLVLPLGGVLADRVGRARIIGWSDVVLSAFVMTTAALFLTGSATVPLLAALGFVSGCLNALWYPAFSGLLPEVVADEHLKPANAFVSFASNGGLIVGAAVGGILVSLAGPGVAIAVDAVSFLVAGLLVLSFRGVSKPSASQESMLGDLVHGWRVFTSFRWVVVVVAASGFVVLTWHGAEQVMGPVLANAIYGGPSGWSVVLSCQAVGLLLGALIASVLPARRPLVVASLVMLSLPLWLVSLSLGLPLVFVGITALAFGIALELFYVLWMTALQQKVPREALSRVSSYDAMGSLMLGPLGLAVSGPMVSAIGVQVSLALFAGLALMAVLTPLTSRAVRGLRAERIGPAATDAGADQPDA